MEQRILVIWSVTDLRDSVSSCAYRCPSHRVQNKTRSGAMASAERQLRAAVLSFEVQGEPLPPRRDHSLGAEHTSPASPRLPPHVCHSIQFPGSGKRFVGVEKVNLSIYLHHPRHTVSENRNPVSWMIPLLPAAFWDHRRTSKVGGVPVTTPLIGVSLKVYYCYCCLCYCFFPTESGWPRHPTVSRGFYGFL